MFTWLEGNGAAAVSFMTGNPELACLKCLKPDPAGASRYQLRRPEAAVEEGRNLACGDAFYIPFPVSRACGAASLACDMVIDWANDVGTTWRSRTFDATRAVQRKDATPHRLAACPACGNRAQ